VAGRPILEQRGVISLAKLYQDQGKREEAHTMLAEMYRKFAEGSDKKDSQEAKALLVELSQPDREMNQFRTEVKGA
jgi:hypothetical protein